MGCWSASPFAPVVELRELGPFGKVYGSNGGESRRVVELAGYPGWLYKEFRRTPDRTDTARLDALISTPASMTGSELEIVDAATGWPASRVTDEYKTVGVLLPAAPPKFSGHIIPRPGSEKYMMLNLDLYANPNQRLAAWGLREQTTGDRLVVSVNLCAVGALLEKFGLVYLDWSYANGFFSPGDCSTFIIDIDGCSFGPRMQTQTVHWEDPLVPKLVLAGTEVDRYRVALFIGRCLTGIRDAAPVKQELVRLQRSNDPLASVASALSRSLSATTTRDRPHIGEVFSVLAAAALGTGAKPTGAGSATSAPTATGTTNVGAGVAGWKPVGRQAGVALGLYRRELAAATSSPPSTPVAHTPRPAAKVTPIHPPQLNETPKLTSPRSAVTVPPQHQTPVSSSTNAGWWWAAAIAVFLVLVLILL